MKKNIIAVLSIVLLGLVVTSCKKDPPKSLLKEYVSKAENWSNRTVYEYDETGKLISEVSQSGDNTMDQSNKTTYEYNEAGQLTVKCSYYNGSPSFKETFKYDENGDTICKETLSYNEGVWKVDEKYNYTYKEGKKKHMYEMHHYLCEGEGPGYDMLVDHVYDVNGKETNNTFYNLGSDSGDTWEINISENSTLSAADEFKQLVADNTMTEPGTTTWTYDANGNKTKMELKGPEYGYTEDFEYDENGNLVKSTNKPFESDGSSVTTYTYNEAGKCLTETSEDNYGGYTSVNTTTYSYDANGDTLQIVYVNSYDGNDKYVSNKVRYVYSAPGVLKYKYYYDREDDWGHDVEGVRKETYNEYRQVVECLNYSQDNYDKQYIIESEYSGTPEEELNHYMAEYTMKLFNTDTYNYFLLEVDNSLWGKITGFFNKKKSSGDSGAKSSKSGVEYDV